MKRFPAKTFRPPPLSGDWEKDRHSVQSYFALQDAWVEEVEWLLSGKLLAENLSSAAAIDHGSQVTGLGDDDHTQYAAVAQAESVTGVWTFTNELKIIGGAFTDEIPVNLASAAEMTVPSTSNYYNVTGGTTITLLGPVTLGRRVLFRFNADTIIYHDATTLVLLNARKTLYHAGSHAMFCCVDGTNWRELWNSFGAVAPGKIEMYGGTAAPPGWYICDGTAVSRTTDEPLFVALSTAFGAGDGSTTFNVPDLRQRFPLGKAAAGTGSTLGGTGGNIDHTHTVDPPNTTSSGASIGDLFAAGAGATNVSTGNHTHTVNVTEFNTGTANPPFQAVNFIVKR